MLLRVALVWPAGKVVMAATAATCGCFLDPAATAGAAEMAATVVVAAMLGMAWGCGSVGRLSLRLPITQWPMALLVQLVKGAVAVWGAVAVIEVLVIQMAS
jgi:hypothetical protein